MRRTAIPFASFSVAKNLLTFRGCYNRNRLAIPQRYIQQEEFPMRRVLFLAAFLFAIAIPVMAQDPVKVDSKHYKVEFENATVRVLRIHYGPHEKSVWHWHPAGAAIAVTDAHIKFNLPGGKSQ